jgi:hypothetical protein
MCFVPTHSILEFIQKENLEELGTMELMVIRIYGQMPRAFILVVINGLGNIDAHALSFYLEFFAQYMQLVKMYSIGNLATLLVKSIGSFWFGEQHLLTNFVTIFVISAPNAIVVKRLIEILKRIKG